MPKHYRSLVLILLALVTLGQAAPPALAGKPDAPPEHWVGTWAAAPFSLDNQNGQIGSADATYRQIVHLSLGGPLLRVELSNEFGTEPLAIAAVHAALSAGSGEISLASANALTFNGKPSVVIPPGGTVVSDPFAIAAPAFADLAISLFLPAQPIRFATWHGGAQATGYRVAGNMVGQKSLPGASAPAQQIHAWFFLKGVEVKVPAEDGAVVTFGDSITDGARSTPDSNARWPNILAERLAGDKKTHGLAVLNEGIGGNRLLAMNTGPDALARFDRDVLAQAGARYVILLEGINDIGHGPDKAILPPGLDGMPPVTPSEMDVAQAIIQALAEMTERAHTRGLIVYLGTLTPFRGAKYFTPEGEQARLTVNAWIRSNKLADGFIDFEEAVRDPSHPDTYRAEDESGDHLHPNDAGYKVMGKAIDLKLFDEKK